MGDAPFLSSRGAKDDSGARPSLPATLCAPPGRTNLPDNPEDVLTSKKRSKKISCSSDTGNRTLSGNQYEDNPGSTTEIPTGAAR